MLQEREDTESADDADDLCPNWNLGHWGCETPQRLPQMLPDRALAHSSGTVIIPQELLPLSLVAIKVGTNTDLQPSTEQ